MDAPSKAPWSDRGPLGFGRWITAADGTQIAVAYGPSVNPNAEVDVRLIAAAPELLAALREITGIFAVSKGMQKAHAIALAAIAKAEGG